MKRFKVLFLSNWYPTADMPTNGIFVREHAKAVASFDDVIVLHQAGTGRRVRGLWSLERELDASVTEGLPTYRVHCRRLPVPGMTGLLLLRSMVKAAGCLAADGFRPDIVHGNVYNVGLSAFLLARCFNAPFVISEHFSAFPKRTLSRVELWKAQAAFRRAARVMPVSESLRRAIEAYGIQSEATVVPNVVDTDLFPPHASRSGKGRDKQLLLVCMLRKSEDKGIAVLVDALKRLERRDYRLNLVGDGPARARYENMVTNAGLDDNVIFHGQKSKAEIGRMMLGMDFFVLPSLWENLPCVVIEAMSAGLPIVATNVGGIPEMVNGNRGRLVPANDPAALSAAIRRMLDDFEDYDCQAISDYARQRFSREVIGRTIHRIYQEVLSR